MYQLFVFEKLHCFYNAFSWHSLPLWDMHYRGWKPVRLKSQGIIIIFYFPKAAISISIKYGVNPFILLSRLITCWVNALRGSLYYQYVKLSEAHASLASMRHWPNVWSMLGQRRRRWANIEQILGQCLMVTGECSLLKHNQLVVDSRRHGSNAGSMLAQH